MDNYTFGKYAKMMRNLSVKVTKGIKAPHKAIMLISIMDLIKDGTIKSNKIFIEDVIADTFRKNWDIFISGEKRFSFFVCSPWTPFWHLKKDGFWHFSPRNTLIDVENLAPRGQTASVGKMRSEIQFAYFDSNLFALFEDPVYRNKFIDILYDEYVSQNYSEHIDHKKCSLLLLSDFKTIRELNLSEKDAIILYEDLRAALERMLPNNFIDASDCDVLTVFPFRIGTGDIPEDYEVENYETGMVGQYPALRKVGKKEEVYILDGELIPCPSTTYK